MSLWSTWPSLRRCVVAAAEFEAEMTRVRAVCSTDEQVKDVIAERLRRLTLAPHRPVDVGDGQVWCLRDRVPWPCDAVVRLTEPPAGQEAP